MPSKNSKKIIFFIIFFVLISFITFCFVVTQPKYLAQAALSFFKKNSSDVTFKEITIEQVQWFSWNKLRIRNARIK